MGRKGRGGLKNNQMLQGEGGNGLDRSVPPRGRGWARWVDISDEWSESDPFFWASGTLPPEPELGRQVKRFREPLHILASGFWAS